MLTLALVPQERCRFRCRLPTSTQAGMRRKSDWRPVRTRSLRRGSAGYVSPDDRYGPAVALRGCGVTVGSVQGLAALHHRDDNGILVLTMPKLREGQPIVQADITLQAIQATRGEHVGHVGRKGRPATTKEHRIAKHKTGHGPSTSSGDETPPVK